VFDHFVACVWCAPYGPSRSDAHRPHKPRVCNPPPLCVHAWARLSFHGACHMPTAMHALATQAPWCGPLDGAGHSCTRARSRVDLPDCNIACVCCVCLRDLDPCCVSARPWPGRDSSSPRLCSRCSVRVPLVRQDALRTPAGSCSTHDPLLLQATTFAPVEALQACQRLTCAQHRPCHAYPTRSNMHACAWCAHAAQACGGVAQGADPDAESHVGHGCEAAGLLAGRVLGDQWTPSVPAQHRPGARRLRVPAAHIAARMCGAGTQRSSSAQRSRVHAAHRCSGARGVHV